MDDIFRVDTAQASKFELWLARTFGKKYNIIDEIEQWGMTYYSFRGKIYVTEYHDYKDNFHL